MHTLDKQGLGPGAGKCVSDNRGGGAARTTVAVQQVLPRVMLPRVVLPWAVVPSWAGAPLDDAPQGVLTWAVLPRVVLSWAGAHLDSAHQTGAHWDSALLGRCSPGRCSPGWCCLGQCSPGRCSPRECSPEWCSPGPCSPGQCSPGRVLTWIDSHLDTCSPGVGSLQRSFLAAFSSVTFKRYCINHTLIKWIWYSHVLDVQLFFRKRAV